MRGLRWSLVVLSAGSLARADRPAPAGALSPVDRTRIAVLDESERLEEQIGETRRRIREGVRWFYRVQRAGGSLAPLGGPRPEGGGTPATIRIRYQLVRRVIGADLKALRASMRRAQILDDLRVRLARDEAAASVSPTRAPAAPPAVAPEPAADLPEYTVAERAGTLVVHGVPDLSFASLRGDLPLPVRGTTQLQVRPRERQVEIGVGPAAIAQAVAPGRVEYAGDYAGMGKMVIVDHGAGWHTVTGGLVTLSVGRGESVLPGQAIGMVGSAMTFEIRREGRTVDAMQWLGLR